MSTNFSDFGVQPEQGPPLAVPLSFFFVASLSVVGAGVLSLFYRDVFLWRGLPWTMALAHIGTLGFLGAVMLGALYQMLAVVASPVPFARAGHLVHLLFVIGAASLVWGFLTFEPRGFTTAWHSLATAFALFVVPVAIALARAKTRTTTVAGIAIAVLALTTLAVMGLLMARVRAGAMFTGDWRAWVYTHLTLGGVTWVGGLLTAVSWQVIPMFYLTDPYPRWSRIGVVLSLLGSSIAVLVILGTGGSADHIVVAAAPGAAAVWILHPLVTLRLLQSRRRKRIDDSINFWRVGLVCAPLVFALAAMTWLSDHPRWPMLLGFTLIWGWAGSIVHGMLSRIVPFLVWFHRYSWLVGKTRVPPMRRLWPKRHLRATLALHVATLVAGVAAVATGSAIAAAVVGVSLVLTGVTVFAGLTRVTLHMRGKSSASEA